MIFRFILLPVLFLFSAFNLRAQYLFEQRRALVDSITAVLNVDGKVHFLTNITGYEANETEWNMQFAKTKYQEDSCICLCLWMYKLADNDTYIFYPEELVPDKINVNGETVSIPFINDDQPLLLHIEDETERNKVITWLRELLMLCKG